MKDEKLKIIFFICYFLFVNYSILFAQETAHLDAEQEEAQQEEPAQQPYLAAPSGGREVWICPSAEMGLFSVINSSYGIGLTAAYGKKVSVGLKASFLFDAGKTLDVLEINFLVRWYPLPSADRNAAGEITASCTGLFLQFTGGPAIFFDRREKVSPPSGIGRISAGLGVGWRFPLGRLFFIEPSIRGGYPFIVGAVLSTGIRF